MKRLTLDGPATPAAPAVTEQQRLIKDIKDFVGKDGLIPFEHGYRPTLNCWAVDENGIRLRFWIGKEKRKEIPFEEMDEKMLTKVIIELFRYMNYCHLEA